MSEKQLSRPTAEEQQLLSKEAINLPPRQRLELLLNAKSYPVARKRTSAKRHLIEMIEFYELLCLMLAQYFPNEKAEDTFFMLSIIASQKDTQSILTEEFAKAFNLLRNYEELERKVTAMQWMFYQYSVLYPELYSSYNLEDREKERISDIIQYMRECMSDEPQYIEKILKRWDLL